MLFINPDECIDCGVCEPECPAEAIQSGTDDNIKWQEINRELSEKSPNISKRKDPLPGADEAKNEPNKFEKYFKENIS
jgi:ferredoxin